MWNPFRVNSPPPPEPPPPPKPKLAPFSEKSTCAKCGHADISMQFWAAENVMIRTCYRCSAKWHEAPLDAVGV